MDHIDQLIELFRQALKRDYDEMRYIKAGLPFGVGRGAQIWLEFEEGTTVN